MNLKKENIKKTTLQYVYIVLLSILMAFNYEIFIFPNSFAPSGINGLATMIQYIFHFNVGYVSLIVNIPFAILGFIFLNKDFSIKSITSVIVFAICLIIFNNLDKSFIDAIQYETEFSRILGPMVAGVINGFIYGCVFKINGSTGGTDFIAAFIRKKRPDFNMMWVIFSINCSIAIMSFFVYGYKLEPVILCIAYCFLTSRVSDMILKGGKSALKFEVITENPVEISDEIIHVLKHSATVIKHAEGMYSHKDKDLLICIINKHQIIDFENIIKKYPGTFAYITSINETVGNFKLIKK